MKLRHLPVLLRADADGAVFEEAFGLGVAEAEGIEGECAVEQIAGTVLGKAGGDFFQFAVEGIHRIAAGKFDGFCIAGGIEDGRGAKVAASARQDRELKNQRGLFEPNFETVVERATLLIDGAARGLDDTVWVVEVEQRVPKFGQAQLIGTAGDDAAWHAEHETDEVGVVDMQIEHGSADLFGKPVVFEPKRLRDDAFEGAAADAAEFAALDVLEGPGVFGEVRQHVADVKLASSGLGGAKHAAAIGDGERHGLFAKYMLATGESAKGDVDMQGRGKGDVNQVDRIVCEQIGQIGVRAHAGEIHLLAAGAEVTLDLAPIAGEAFAVLLAECDNSYIAELLIGEVVNHPHEAEAGNADANHVDCSQAR